MADQDDIWNDGKLDHAIKVIKRDDLDGYSSDVIAFWSNGREKLVKKSFPQKKFDYFFEAAGPGCTYVLKEQSVQKFKKFLIKSWGDVNLVELHDWMIYAYFRSQGMKWKIDDKIDPDIILSYLLRPDLIVSVVRCRAVKISSVRNMIDRLYRQSHGMLAGIFFGFLHKSALSRFDKLIVMSGDMKNFFLENSFDENKLVLIHNSLDEEDVELKKKDEINFPFNDNLPVIISTSSLTKVKNVSLLIKTSIELLDKGLKFNILIIGDGDQRGELINIVNASKYNNNFYFSGHLSNPIPYLIRSDIFIMTSISEGVSRSLMEALYFGRICIISNIDGNRELIKDKFNGYLFSNKSELKHLIEINIATQKTSIDSFLLSDFSYLKSLEAHKTLFNSLH